MAVSIGIETKQYFKAGAPNRMVGYGAYKDYKIVTMTLNVSATDNESGTAESSVCEHRIENDGIILCIAMQAGHNISLPDAATAGGYTDAMLQLQGYPLANCRCSTRDQLATDSGYRPALAKNQQLVLPNLMVPVEEWDLLKLYVYYGHYAASGGSGEFEGRAMIYYIEK